MKRFTLFLLPVAIATASWIPAAGQTNPCDDPIYLQLQEKEIEEMSDREFEIFREKSRACTEYLSKPSPAQRVGPAVQQPVQLPASQSVTPPAVQTTVPSGSYLGADSYLTGMSEGKALADNKSVAGSTVGGLFGGVFLGLIGTGIAYAAQSKPQLSSQQLEVIAERDKQYQVGYVEGFQESLHKRKRNAALLGGLAGTALIVTIFVSSY